MQTTALALLGLASVATGWILMFIVPGARVFAWGILAVGAVLIVRTISPRAKAVPVSMTTAAVALLTAAA